MADTIKKGQRVLVSYGLLTNGHTVARYAVSGYVRKRVARKPDWFEVELGWDVDAQQLSLVTAHRSAITLNGYVS